VHRRGKYQENTSCISKCCGVYQSAVRTPNSEVDRDGDEGSVGETEEVKPLDWRDWWRDAGMMGISPSELKYITPYEFSLLREGFQKKQEADWERSRFEAWVTYAMQASGDVMSPEEFHPLPSDILKKNVTSKLPEEIEIDANYKAEQEAKMNQI